MRLTAIKLAGFKSFVDATTFHAPTNLTGVVGPNGCGKSNIIDAVRWVMGEGSARVLRGELMSDVIFSGSSTRKPVGTATVELIFDNSDGKIGGEFARFNEISVKRIVARDGISNYTLNGTRCRRKDIRDLFLGTGLGSKSYSIIEQGMISQVVEAKPEDIRAHLEEAAGISRYKERRRETESRIRHTRENLDRLSDLREEVGSHLDRLKRQARAAERYRKLKQQRRELESRLLALQWRDQMALATEGKESLQRLETTLQAHLAKQRAAEKELEQIHQRQAEATEAFNEVQGELYSVGSEIARLEQSIQHSREIQARQKKEYGEVSASLKDLEQHMVLDRAQVEDLTARLAQAEPELSKAQQAESAADRELKDAEAEVQAWQDQLEEQYQESKALSQAADQLRARIEVLDQRMAAASERKAELENQTEGVDTAPLAKSIDALSTESQTALGEEDRKQRELDGLRLELTDQQDLLRQGVEQENELQRQLHALNGRLEALKALQQAAREGDGAGDWLARQDLADAPRLLSVIQTEKGWEAAVEIVLGDWLDFVLSADPRRPAAHLPALEAGSLGILQDASGKVRPRSGSLAEKVKAPDAVVAILNHVMIADDLAAAVEYFDNLADEESAVTRAGEWVGPGWVRVARAAGGQAGMLAREQEITALEEQLGDVREQWQKQQSGNEKYRAGLQSLEASIQELQVEVNQLHRTRSELEGRLSSDRDRVAYLDRRSQQIEEERQRLEQQQAADSASVKDARKELEAAVEKMAGSESRRAELDRRRAALLERRDTARSWALSARDRSHELALDARTHRASLDSLRQSLERMDSQVNQLQQRYLSLSEHMAASADPEAEHKAEMDSLLAQRIEVEKRLAGARAHTQGLESQYREQDGARQLAVQAVEEQRQSLERARLGQQEIELHARSLQRQVEANEEDVAVLAETLPADATSEAWLEEIERLSLRITRLEPVNLAAIQEYEEELKRKEYLDAQNDDLNQALTTLENAIAKIDRKTRTRFKDTFEMVNKGIQELFPRLFGGGHAYLELTGEDLLTTGVSIMARPPGKRVSSIHLLSGGEKALTAVAFVFSIFRLNAAPFCLLDEVDAPLDDANVGRFSAMVKEMSEAVQFIVVTHNKITMEMVHQLSGVTMREPGVSRLVQVDIEEAASLAAS
jgi:chromosome segregation protein